MNTNTLNELRKIDTTLAEVYALRNRQIGLKTAIKNSLQYARFEDSAIRYRARLVIVEEEISNLDSEIDRINESYTGWTRFFHVQHLHSSANCSSFRWNTRIVFVPEISGLTEEEAVAEFGKDLCTICFKSAPTK